MTGGEPVPLAAGEAVYWVGLLSLDEVSGTFDVSTDDRRGWSHPARPRVPYLRRGYNGLSSTRVKNLGTPRPTHAGIAGIASNGVVVGYAGIVGISGIAGFAVDPGVAGLSCNNGIASKISLAGFAGICDVDADVRVLEYPGGGLWGNA